MNALGHRKDVSRHELECLLGSLRHVSTCLRSARPFFQRLHLACKRAPRRGRIPVTDALRLDVAWLRIILERGDWGGFPTSMFWREPHPCLHLYMDASNEGLAVLAPAHKRYIQIRFDDDESHDITSATDANGFTINVRELFCVALAAVVWGENWKPRGNGEVAHIRAWSDNASAVAWVQTQRSDNRLAQELIRVLGLCEATSRFRISTHHLPGAINLAADAASRAWSEPYRYRWTIYSRDWIQTPVPPDARYLYKTFSQIYRPTHWPNQATKSMRPHESNGVNGVPAPVCRRGSPEIKTPTPLSSSRSRYRVGIELTDRVAIRPPPFCPNLATSAGIIGEFAATPSASMRDTDSLCKGCHGCRQHHEENAQCQPFFSVEFDPTAISSPKTTAFSGGLRSWAFSSYCEDRST